MSITRMSLRPLLRFLIKVGPSTSREAYVLTCISVVWKDGKETFISNPTDFPEPHDSNWWQVQEIQEPVVNATIIVPQGLSHCPGQASMYLRHVSRLPGRHDGPMFLS